MKPVLVLVFVFLQLQDAYTYFTQQPDFVKTCSMNGPDNFVNCSTHAVQALFDALPPGIPEVGLQPLDPLKVPVIHFLQGSGPVNVNASLTNVTVLGFGHPKVVRNIVYPGNYSFYTELSLPTLRIDGQYVLLGKILVIPLKGAGTCWFDAKNLDIAVYSNNKLTKKDGFHFFSIQDVKVKFTIGGLKLYLGNLFDGIKALEKSTNAYLNQHWRLVADSLNPLLSRTIEDIMLEILRKVFDNIPADYFINDIVDSPETQQ